MPRVVDVDERRAALTSAAARVIARDGLAAASMRTVATEAGATTGAITHYFADKRALLAATLEASLEGRRAERPARAGLPPAEALRATLANVLPLTDESILHWTVTVAFCAQAAGDPKLALVQREAYRDFRANVAALAEAAGRARGAAAVAEAERLIAVTDGVAIQALFDPETWPAERQLAMLDAALV